MYRYLSSMSLELYIRALKKSSTTTIIIQGLQQFSLPIIFAFASWQILLLALLDAIPKKFQNFIFSLHQTTR